MNSDREFCTISMAKVYAAQGHMKKAAEIYRQLLKRWPERRDIAEALSTVEGQKTFRGPEQHIPLNEKTTRQNPDDLSTLFDKWVRLLLQYNHIRRLRIMLDGEKRARPVPEP